MHITYLILDRVLQLSTEGVKTRVCDEREATLRLIFSRKDVGPLDVVSTNQPLYSSQSLIYMGFQKINGEWKRLEGRKKAAEEEESSKPSVSHRRPQSRQTNSLDQTNFTQLSEMIQQGFDKLSQLMSQMDKKISTLEDYILQMPRND